MDAGAKVSQSTMSIFKRVRNKIYLKEIIRKTLKLNLVRL